jgi:adenylosuccinate lyase
MAEIFSSTHKYRLWRKLWIALAKAEKSLGLPISETQIDSLEKAADTINFERAAFHEKRLKHDVMAHIHAFGEEAPEAKGIIHLGATSCYITDNADLLQMKEALELLQARLVGLIRTLSDQAKKYANLPCLSYTHLQPAQPTTAGRRICLWIQDLLMDLEELSHCLSTLRFLGAKGATGTQASFLALFEGDETKVQLLEEHIALEMGFSNLFSLSGQTYTRKQDVRILHVLKSIAISAHKFSTDLRLLAHMKEMEEPFEVDQVGSSAMPYKRNPHKAERLSGLSRYLISLTENPTYTAALQWLERSLDDSVNRRLCIPESFLAADSILTLYHHIASNLVVYPKVMEKRLEEELPFLATENILMASAKKGKDRQKVHEALKIHSLQATKKLKLEGEPTNLLKEIAKDPEFGLSEEELKALAKSALLLGRAPKQTEDFLEKEVGPILQRFHALSIPSFKIEI